MPTTETKLRLDHSLRLISDAEKCINRGMHQLAASKSVAAIAELKAAIGKLTSVQLVQQSEADIKRADAIRNRA